MPPVVQDGVSLTRPRSGGRGGSPSVGAWPAGGGAVLPPNVLTTRSRQAQPPSTRQDVCPPGGPGLAVRDWHCRSSPAPYPERSPRYLRPSGRQPRRHPGRLPGSPRAPRRRRRLRQTRCVPFFRVPEGLQVTNVAVSQSSRHEVVTKVSAEGVARIVTFGVLGSIVAVARRMGARNASGGMPERALGDPSETVSQLNELFRDETVE